MPKKSRFDVGIDSRGPGDPFELVVGVGDRIEVVDWRDVWSRISEYFQAVSPESHVAWIVFDAGGDIVTANALNRSGFEVIYPSFSAMRCLDA